MIWRVCLIVRQVFHPYWKWEDFLAGMWRKVSKDEETQLLKIAIEFTGDHVRYGAAMQRVVKEWPITMEHNLTDNNVNHRAFVGHCAVCLELGIPEYIVRSAWSHLTTRQQVLANSVADLAIHDWRCNYTGGQKCKGYQLELTF